MLKIKLAGVAMFVVATASACSAADRIEWHATVDAGWAEAKASGRPLLIFVTTPSCRYCEKLKAQTLSRTVVADQVNSEFVPVRVGAKDAPKVVQTFRVTAYPTTLIVSPDAKLIGRIKGYVGPEEFRKRLSAAHRVAALPKRTRSR